jgi:hypothetical protein
MKKLMLCAAVTMSVVAFAAPPPVPGPKHGPRGDMMRDDADPGAYTEDAARRARTMYVVAIADALGLGEADALKLSEKIKALDARRAPIRLSMHEAMRSVKAAAEGDQAALAQVDANVAQVLDGRAQMAALDKELFQVLAKDLAPQQRAKLALVLAKMGQLKRGGAGRR